MLSLGVSVLSIICCSARLVCFLTRCLCVCVCVLNISRCVCVCARIKQSCVSFCSRGARVEAGPRVHFSVVSLSTICVCGPSSDPGSFVSCVIPFTPGNKPTASPVRCHNVYWPTSLPCYLLPYLTVLLLLLLGDNHSSACVVSTKSKF